MPQVAEAGVARAEIAHDDGAAERTEFRQRAERRVRVVQEEALGDLQFEPVRRQAGNGQRVAHQGDEVGAAAELRRGGRLPPVRVGAGATQHSGADGRDQHGFLGDGDERVGWYGAALRVRPTRQRFEADEGAVGQAMERLAFDPNQCARATVA